MTVFFDTNVVLDVYLEREASSGSKHLLEVTVAADFSIFVAWHTAATTYYIFRSRSKLPDAECRAHLIDLISWAEVVPSGTPELKHALSIEMRDFEDAMQIAAAVQCGADVIVTRNTRDFAASPVPALTPEAFLARYFPEASPATP